MNAANFDRMKNFLFYTILFGVLAVSISGLSGCEGNGSAATSNIAAKSSDYPMLEDKIAQAELKRVDNSSTFKVADEKGKVLLLNLWATWCGPCRNEMPVLIQMQNEHRDAGLEVIGLNVGIEDTKVAVDKFANEMALNYTLAWIDTDTQAAMLKISRFPGIPQSFLIDRDGRLRGVFRGSDPAEVAKMKEIVAKVVKGEDSTLSPETPAAPGSDPTSSQPINAAPAKKMGKGSVELK